MSWSGVWNRRAKITWLRRNRGMRPRKPPRFPIPLSDLAGLPKLGSVQGYLEAAAATLRGRGQSQPTSQNTLARIDALYKHQDAWEATAFAAPPDAEARLVGFLRGPDPEFRDPIRF